jgi:2-dehydro-3-deoxyphosphogluconate aldolase/(4S)-4-hydroxy-2-oxoglutarate aldolase
MRIDRVSVLEAILDVGAVPTFCPNDDAAARRVVSACHEAGARVIEITNRVEGTHRLFRDLVVWASAEFPDVILGAGSIYEAPTAAMFIDAGAGFIVTPILSAEVARLCNRRRVAYIPACATATEISDAEEVGVEIIKLFPAAALDGAEFVRGIHRPSPMTRIMPTNVAATEEETKAWFAAGVACVGVGSDLITQSLQADPDPSLLTARLREYMGWVSAARTAAAGAGDQCHDVGLS